MKFAELIDQWGELVGEDIATLFRPGALDYVGTLTLTHRAIARSEPP